MKQILSKDEVAKAMSEVVAQGKKPTLAILHAALQHRGSMSTLVRLKAEVEAAAQPANDSPDALKAFREIWALAVEEGRMKQENVICELRETLKTLSAENERLDATALAAQNRVAELEQAAAHAKAELTRIATEKEQQLNQIQATLVQATKQSADALGKLAQVQSQHSSEVTALQSSLTNAIKKNHELELKFVRAQSLLEAKGVKVQ